MVCTAGPQDRPYEEQHSCTAIAIVAEGTFQYRSQNGSYLMTPGSLLLGNAGHAFECGHEHGSGDRCISFSYTAEFFERLRADVRAGNVGSNFNTPRLPPVRSLSPFTARVSTAIAGSTEASWDELSIQLAAQALELDRGLSLESQSAEPGAIARVTRVVRMIDCHSDSVHHFKDLAREARLSPWHFLRTFQSITGVTPHQYLLRTRLRRAAIQLGTGKAKILDIAVDTGFGDISNFNRTFRAEFGVGPRTYRSAGAASHAVRR